MFMGSSNLLAFSLMNQKAGEERDKMKPINSWDQLILFFFFFRILSDNIERSSIAASTMFM